MDGCSHRYLKNIQMMYLFIMDIYNILQCALYLEHPDSTKEFVKHGYVDMDAICKNNGIKSIFVFINAFRNILGCPPSYKIVRTYMAVHSQTTLHCFFQQHWPFIHQNKIQSAVSNATCLATNPHYVNDEILANLRHFSKCPNEKSIIMTFIRTFPNIENWNAVNAQLNETLSYWYNMYKCINSSCVVSLAKYTPYNASVLDVLSNYTGTKLHVMNIDTTSSNYLIHKNSHLLHPIKCYISGFELHDDCIKISNGQALSRVMKQDELHDELLFKLLKQTMNNKKANMCWNRVIRLWNDLGPVTPFAPGENNTNNAIVAIESRKNPLTIMACLLTCKYLDKTKWKGLVLFCNTEHVEYYTKHLGAIIHKVIPLEELSICHFALDDYNNLLKGPRIWDILATMGISKILTVQDDGFLIRYGAERFLEYDYVGAPWESRGTYNADGVGNGGLSIRSVQAMKDVSNKFDTKEEFAINARCRLFVQSPEDVFFSTHVPVLGYKVCPRNIALHFSSEQVMTKGCCGIHKPWAYLPDLQLNTLFSDD
jgi:hypothetical protein